MIPSSYFNVNQLHINLTYRAVTRRKRIRIKLLELVIFTCLCKPFDIIILRCGVCFMDETCTEC